ncbi:hypothetical protein QBD01_003914 [Ochrobactrum sp. 19YEA23]|nr:hypothetical protein [Ochrobactrum sp. 19YEA23]
MLSVSMAALIQDFCNYFKELRWAVAGELSSPALPFVTGQ